MISVQEAKSLIKQQAKTFGVESVSIHEAYGRVLAEDIFSDRDYPPFNRAAMDGYAIIGDDFLSEGIKIFQVLEEIHAGQVSKKTITSGECYKIMTGSVTPLAADTIIRIEDAEENNRVVKFTTDQIRKGQNIAKKGEDKKEGALLLKKGTMLHAPEISVLAVLGKMIVSIHKLPRVAIISTGNEVVSPDQTVLPHQIRDSNSYALESFLKHYSINVSYRKLVPDNKEKLKEAIREVLNCDLILLSGGVSMGDADYVPEVLNSVGIEKIFHKVKIKPGKPLWFGRSEKAVVFGLPGNPMSVQVAFKVFIEPYLRKCLGLSESTELKLPICSSRKKKVSLEEYFPCRIEDGELKEVQINGSGDITSTLYSQGLAVHEAERENLKEGDLVYFYFWNSIF